MLGQAGPDPAQGWRCAPLEEGTLLGMLLVSVGPFVCLAESGPEGSALLKVGQEKCGVLEAKQ